MGRSGGLVPRPKTAQPEQRGDQQRPRANPQQTSASGLFCLHTVEVEDLGSANGTSLFRNEADPAKAEVAEREPR